MYRITLGLDGRYHCEGQLQDGIERWIKPTLEEAVASMKGFASAANGQTKLKKKAIKYYQERQVVRSELFPWQPYEVKETV